MQVKKTCIAVMLATTVMTTGCASVENKDPLEGFNRAVYKFNDTADKAVIKPVAGAYKAVLPTPVRSGVGNFFANLSTFVSAINNVLQFKFGNAFDDAGRFVINSTFGIAGLVDVASMDGVPQHREDFGQTLGHWGMGDGAYLVLPFLGPSTLRDTGGLAVDSFFFRPVRYVEEPATRNALLATEMLDFRAQLLPGSDLLDEAALDPYAFMRDAYLQRRHHQIEDGAATEAAPEADNEYESLLEQPVPVALQAPEETENVAVSPASPTSEVSVSVEVLEATTQETEKQAVAKELNDVNIEATTALQVETEQTTAPEIQAAPVEFAPAIPTADMVNLNVG